MICQQLEHRSLIERRRAQRALMPLRRDHERTVDGARLAAAAPDQRPQQQAGSERKCGADEAAEPSRRVHAFRGPSLALPVRRHITSEGA